MVVLCPRPHLSSAGLHWRNLYAAVIERGDAGHQPQVNYIFNGERLRAAARQLAPATAGTATGTTASATGVTMATGVIVPRGSRWSTTGNPYYQCPLGHHLVQRHRVLRQLRDRLTESGAGELLLVASGDASGHGSSCCSHPRCRRGQPRRAVCRVSRQPPKRSWSWLDHIDVRQWEHMTLGEGDDTRYRHDHPVGAAGGDRVDSSMQ